MEEFKLNNEGRFREEDEDEMEESQGNIFLHFLFGNLLMSYNLSSINCL